MPTDCVPIPHSLLRDKAEAILAEKASDRAPAGSANKLLHELQVHQIELEIQNETLRLAQQALEESRDRYADLYENAPVSYLTLNDSGQITDVNRTGASLLDDDPGKLRQSSFECFVVAEDRGSWRRHFAQALQGGGQTDCELRMQRRNETQFDGHLLSSLIRAGDGLELRVALTDITAKRWQEEARRLFAACLFTLTRREREVLVLALSGMPNRDISSRLRVHQRTVENHRSRIHRKTGVASLLELAQQAANAGVALTEIAPSFHIAV